MSVRQFATAGQSTAATILEFAPLQFGGDLIELAILFPAECNRNLAVLGPAVSCVLHFSSFHLAPTPELKVGLELKR